MSLLFVRPADDSTTQLLATWGQSIRNLAQNHTTNDLSAAQVTRPVLNQEMAKHSHLFWFGHGLTDELTAQGQAMVDKKNLTSLGGGIAVAIACHAAVGLGHLAAPNTSCRAFLGFDDEFTIPAKAPLPMQLALRRGLDCLFSASHDIGCATQQLWGEFLNLRDDYKQNGASYGLSAGEIRLAWMCAKNNQYSLQQTGDSSATL